jgi:hypothetical protein
MEISMLHVLHLRGTVALLLTAAFSMAVLAAGAAQAQTKIITGMVAHGPP